MPGRSYGRMLARRAQRERQRVQPAAELSAERVMNQAVPGDAGEGLEARRDGEHAVMRLAAGLGARVAGVARAVVHDLDLGGRERRPQSFLDALGAARACWHDGVA